jgi:hypothetical protein
MTRFYLPKTEIIDVYSHLVRWLWELRHLAAIVRTVRPPPTLTLMDGKMVMNYGKRRLRRSHPIMKLLVECLRPDDTYQKSLCSVVTEQTASDLHPGVTCSNTGRAPATLIEV